MKETVEMIVRALVDDQDSVDLREIDRNGASIIEIRVAQQDMGKIIGRQGRTIRALRTLANAAGTKQKRRFILEIVE